MGNRRVYRYVIVLLLIVQSSNGMAAKKYQLFSGGQSTYSIIVSKDASESEEFVANELQSYLSQAGNVAIPIKHCGEGKNGYRIIVGYNKDVKTLFPDIRKPLPEDEGFYYKSCEGDIVIVGGSERGTMYGVFAFLENELGCRWYSEKCTVVPKRNSYSFVSLDYSDAPAISIRNIMYSEFMDATFRVHCRANGRIKTGPAKPWPQPGGGPAMILAHTLSFLLPADEHFEKHPEYYALRNGERVSKQPCFSNPNVLSICTNNLLRIMRERPEFDNYEVSALDNCEHCECSQCKAAIARLGNYSDLVLDFVNKIAEAVETEFPDKKIQYLAYQGTRHPPLRVKPRRNVAVMVSNIECCHVHGFEQCGSEDSKQFLKELQQWRRITDELNIWDYANNFSAFNIPFPNFYALQDNLKTYQRMGIKYILMEGDHYTYNGEFQALRIYVLSRLLWNPDCDLDELVNDFLRGYYGASAPYMRQYFDLIHNRVQKDTHLNINTSYRDHFYKGNFIANALKIFKRAKSVANNDEIRRRVEMEEFSACLLNTLRDPQQAIADGTYWQAKKVMERENIDLRNENLKQRISQIKMDNGEAHYEALSFWGKVKAWFRSLWM